MIFRTNISEVMNEENKRCIIPGNGSPIVGFKINRNAKCKCGSGKKQKVCCGTGTKYYNSQDNPKPKVKTRKVKERGNVRH